MRSQSYHRKRGHFSVTRIVQYSILILVVIIVITPVALNAMGGMKTRGEYMTRPYTIPIPPRWDNYLNILGMSSFWLMLWNSILVMLGATGGVVLFCSMAAFVFSRLKFRGLNVIFNIYTVGLMFPINIAILPVFLTLRQAGLTNTLIGVIIVQIVYELSGNILILRNFFRSVPVELQDAAYLDGCNAFDFYWRILIPLALPSLAAVAALTMIKSWNDLLVPLVVLDKESLWTLPLGTMQFQGQYGQDLALIAAFVTLSAVPPILFYLIAERQIVSGLTAGALKG